jgi:hypothetical protein
MSAKRPATILAFLGLAGCTGGTPGSGSIAGISEALTSQKTCVDLPTTGDATISESELRKNFGASKVLRVGERAESLVAFDLGAIPKNAALDSATLKLYLADSDRGESIGIHRVTTPWSESTVTFASFGQRFDRREIGTVNVGRASNVQKSVDLTDLAKAWQRGASANHGILLEGNRCHDATLVSREGGTAAQRPALRVCYTQPEDHCASKPCANAGTCENTASAYLCQCATGFAGKRCETNVDDCAANPCQNGGACHDAVGGYTCSCPAGFSGPDCAVDVDDCAAAPCVNGGVCEDRVAGYLCHCPPGFEGARCESPVNRCAAAPCLNGGTCTSSTAGYACACAAGFAGANCEIDVDDCAAAPCRNGGTCLDRVNGYSCACAPDWGGVTCDVNLNTCAQKPCLNGGACVNGAGSYTCTCAAGFAGGNCEVDVNDCAPNPCQHGGVCVDGVGAFTCTCAAGFTGATCEIPPSFHATETELVFGKIAALTSASRTVTVSNEAALPTGIVSSTPIGPDLSQFQVSDECAGKPLGAGASCNVTVTFAPTFVGNKSAGWRLVTADGAEIVLSFRGVGVAPALFLAQDTAANFSIVAVGATAAKTLSFSNMGGLPTGIVTSTPIGPDSSQFQITDECAGKPLDAYATCKVTVTFAPTTPGDKNAGWRLVTADGAAAVVSFRGTALRPANLAISPSGTYNLGATAVGAVGSTAIFTVVNAGYQAPTGPLAVTLSNSTDFSIVSNDCSSLPTGGSCAVRVGFTPKSAGPRSATLTVQALGVAPVQVVVGGTGTCAAGTVGPLCESTCPPGTTGASCQWFVCSAGAPDGSPCSDGNACTQTDTCVGGVCVGSNPVDCAPRDACHLQGTCAPATGQCDMPLRSDRICVPPTIVGGVGTLEDFGAVALGETSAPLTASFTNTGDVEAVGATAVLSGPNADQFSIVSNGCARIAPNANCIVTVAYSPTTTFYHFANVVLSFSGQTATTLLRGRGVYPAMLAISPSPSVDFGAVPAGQTGRAQTFTLTNFFGQAATGDITPTLSDATNFTIVSSACTRLAEGTSCTMQVAFTPHASGPLSAQLTVGATPGGTQTCLLAGVGL